MVLPKSIFFILDEFACMYTYVFLTREQTPFNLSFGVTVMTVKNLFFAIIGPFIGLWNASKLQRDLKDCSPQQLTASLSKMIHAFGVTKHLEKDPVQALRKLASLLEEQNVDTTELRRLIDRFETSCAATATVYPSRFDITMRSDDDYYRRRKTLTGVFGDPESGAASRAKRAEIEIYRLLFKLERQKKLLYHL
jgi:hypothetical protein